MGEYANIKDRIKQLRISHGMSQQDLAEKLGVTNVAVSQWERGVKQPKMELREALCDLFNVNIEYLNGNWDKISRLLTEDEAEMIDQKRNSSYSQPDNILPIDLKRFPLLGEIACGKPVFCNEDRESYVLAGSNIKADFCLKARGDSMINARILDGDIVFIREQPSVNNGEIAAVIIDNEATLKRFMYYKDQNIVILKAENPAFQDIILQGNALNSVRVLGKAIAFQSDVK